MVALWLASAGAGLLLSSYSSLLVDCPSPQVRLSASPAQPAVELFSALGCGFCSRAKARLAQLAVPFTEVDVGSSEALRSEMAERAGGCTSVPQIFIGGVHLGGCDELIAAEQSGELKKMLAPLGIEPLKRAPQLMGEVAEEEESLGDVKNMMPRTGILNHQPLPLVSNGFDLPGPLFPEQGPAAPVPTAAQLSASLQRQILTLYDEFVAPDGTRVDYSRLTRSPAFRDYLSSAAQLRSISEASLPTETGPRLAFWINVYNALVIHGLAVVGPPVDADGRARFYGGETGVAYDVGGWRLSLDDIEHAILRGSPPADKRSFPDDDPRRPLAIPRDEFDPRVHFALNCGAKSCPPIKIYDADNLEAGLALAASAFLETEVAVDVPKRRVTLSKLLMWYGDDFGEDERDVLRRISHMLSPDHPTATALEELFEGDGPITVEYAEYDWGINAA